MIATPHTIATRVEPKEPALRIQLFARKFLLSSLLDEPRQDLPRLQVWRRSRLLSDISG